MTRLGAGDALTAAGGRKRHDRSTAPTVSRSAAWTALAWPAGLTALLVYLALTPLPPFASDVYGSLVRRYVVLGVVLLGYLLWLVVTRRLPRRSTFDLPLAALTLVVLIAVIGSLDRRVSAEHLLPLLPSLVLFYLLHDLRSLDQRALAWCVVVAGTVVAGMALASVWRAWDDWWSLIRAVDGGLRWSTLLPPETPRLAGIGNHPNVLGAVFAMTLPALLFAWTEIGHRRLRGLLVVAVLVAVAALFFTLSRAAWAGAAIGLVATGAGYAIAGSAVPRLSRRTWLVAAAVLLTIALIGGWLVFSGARPEWLFRDSLGPRADMRRAGWQMFLDNPLTGAGPGLFAALYPLYDGAHPFAAVHSHNIVVQTALDMGVAGLLAGAFLLSAVAWAIRRGLRAGDPASGRAVAAGGGMLVAGLVHALADSPQLFPEVQAFAVVALVMIARGAERAPARPAAGRAAGRRFNGVRRAVRMAGRAGPALAVLLALALPVLWLITGRAHQAYAESVWLAGEERWPEAVAAADRAVDRDGRLAANWFQLGAAHASAAIEGDRRAEQQAALDALRRGLELEPHNGAALVNYAALNVALDRPEAARAALPALARLAGRDSLLLLAHATLIQWTAPPEQAIETYAGLLVINPTLAATPFWQDDGFREQSFDRIVDRALARVAEVTGDAPAAASLRTAINVYAGRESPSLTDLQTALAARPDDAAVRVAAGRLLMRSEATRGQAFEMLRGAVRLKSDDPTARAALGDWYALDGDLDRARREWAAASYLGDLGATVSLGNSYPADAVPKPVRRRGEQLLLGAEVNRFYLIFQTYRFTFMRAEPVPIILPGDWLLALPSELEDWRQAVERWSDLSPGPSPRRGGEPP
jgi:O-antigen ligase/tetratricopeptide (TPR) repeat protein